MKKQTLEEIRDFVKYSKKAAENEIACYTSETPMFNYFFGQISLCKDILYLLGEKNDRS